MKIITEGVTLSAKNVIICYLFSKYYFNIALISLVTLKATLAI